MSTSHFFYKTTNLVNGKYYLGVHSSKNPGKDSYIGSGRALKAAIKKYGRKNFKCEILKYFDSQEEAFEYEKTKITLKEVLDPMCYNMQLGGIGGTKGSIVVTNGTEYYRILPENEEFYKSLGFQRYHKVHSPETLRKMSESHKGHTLTEEQKEKRGKMIKNWIWLFNGTEEIRVPSENLKSYLEQGWIRGRNPERGQRISQTLKEYNKNSIKPKRIYVHRGSEALSILAEDAELYFGQGWSRGNGKTGRHLPEETRRKLSEANKGKPNMTKGRVWIHKGHSEQKRVFPEDLESWLTQGWTKGHSENYKNKVKATSMSKKS